MAKQIQRNIQFLGGLEAAGYKATSAIVNNQTGTTYTLAAADNGKVVILNNASAITVTVPAGLGAGFSCVLIQQGAGQVTVTTSGGATLQSFEGKAKLAGQYAGATVFAHTANIFNLTGSLVS
jgi:hypothetical protein